LGSHRLRVLLLAVSEGGPPIVHSILSQLPAGFPIPIVILQVFRSGPIDPICNALSRTTRLRVSCVEGYSELRSGEAVILPYASECRFGESTGILGVTIEDNTPDRSELDTCAEVLAEVGRFFRDGTQVAFAGLLGKNLMSLRNGIRSIVEHGGTVLFVKETRAIISPEVRQYIESDSQTGIVSPDEMVARIHRWSGLTEYVKPPT